MDDNLEIDVPKTKIRINRNALITIGASLAAVALGLVVGRLKKEPEVVADIKLVDETPAA